MYVEFSHEIVVVQPPSQALRLFTPKGEEAWVPGWKPDYVSPETGETMKEMLFVTPHGDEKTYWTCLAWDPDAGHVRYLRLTPMSRMGFVDVKTQLEEPDRTRVRVLYQLHGLSETGNAHLSDMTQSSFEAMIDEWEQLIRQNLTEANCRWPDSQLGVDDG